MKYDFIVVGAGFAGLCVAELLQRSGRSVLLLEKRDKICGLSSAQQQGWFHTGALYTVHPDKRYFLNLINNLENIMIWYREFSGMNLARAWQGEASEKGWFNGERFHYFYNDKSDSSVPRQMAMLWPLAMRLAQARLAMINQVDLSEVPLKLPSLWRNLFSPCATVQKEQFNFDLGKICQVVLSKDVTINSCDVAEQLLGAYLASGGELKLNSEVVKLAKGGVGTKDAFYEGRETVLTIGPEIDCLYENEFTKVKSPLFVVSPALSKVNFVKLTPVVSRINNHVCHRSAKGDYSVIGDGSYYPKDAQVDKGRIYAEGIKKIRKMFRLGPHEDLPVKMYFGFKTEVARRCRIRNYHQKIIPAENCVVAFPGKLSLSFSLAVEICRYYGVEPVVGVPLLSPPPDGMVQATEHYSCFAST